MSNIVLDVTTIENMVGDFDKKFKDPINSDIATVQVEIDGLESKKQDHTYDLLAELTRLCIALEVFAPGEGLGDWLKKRGQKIAKQGFNIYLPVVKAIFSKKVKGSWEFVDRGVEKYANIVRLLILEIEDSRLTVEAIPAYIRDFDDPIYGKKMLGIEKKDRKENRNTAHGKRVSDARNRGKNATSKLILPSNFGVADEKVVQLWGRVRNGQFEVMEYNVANDDEADSLWYKLGRSIPK